MAHSVRQTWDLSCCLQPMAACALWIPYLYLCICVCICVLDLCRYKIWGKVGPPPTTPCHLGIAPRGKKLPPQCRVSGTHLFDPLSYLFPRTQGGGRVAGIGYQTISCRFTKGTSLARFIYCCRIWGKLFTGTSLTFSAPWEDSRPFTRGWPSKSKNGFIT